MTKSSFGNIKFLIVCPIGSVEIEFEDGEDTPPIYSGDPFVVKYVKNEISMMTGHGGITLNPEFLDPSDIDGFCNQEPLAVFPNGAFFDTNIVI